MAANQVARCGEKRLKIAFQSAHHKYFGRHVDNYVHIAVMSVGAACHGTEKSQGFNAELILNPGFILSQEGYTFFSLAHGHRDWIGSRVRCKDSSFYP